MRAALRAIFLLVVACTVGAVLMVAAGARSACRVGSLADRSTAADPLA